MVSCLSSPFICLEAALSAYRNGGDISNETSPGGGGEGDQDDQQGGALLVGQLRVSGLLQQSGNCSLFVDLLN